MFNFTSFGGVMTHINPAFVVSITLDKSQNCYNVRTADTITHALSIADGKALIKVLNGVTK